MPDQSQRRALITRRSFRRPAKLTPPHAQRLRSRAIRLAPGTSIAWHSTRRREELLIILEGSVSVEAYDRRHRVRTTRLTPGACAFLAAQVRHRVVNRSARPAQYIYVTG